MSNFAIRNLSVLNYANGFTLWHYRANTLAEVDQPGFFTSAADMMASGDMIFVSAGNGGMHLFVLTTTPLVILLISTTGTTP